MKEIPNVVAFGGMFMFGLWWIINRRNEIENGTLLEKHDDKEVK